MDKPGGVGIERALEPHSLVDFLGEVWEQRPLVIQRGAKSHFTPLISTADFDEIVATTALRHPYFRIFRGGVLLPVEQTTTSRQLGPDLDSGLADLNKMYDEYAAGGTLALQAAERWWPPLRELARDFQAALGFPIQVHVYLTPSNARGAPVHYDTHDVFVLQVEGEKSWDVWSPVRTLPMRLSEDSYDQRAVDDRSAEEPNLSLNLRAGDSLYLPRGFIHRAGTGTASSLHVTVSVMVHRWIDVARSAVSSRLDQLRDEPTLRRSIPFGRSPMAQPTIAERAAYDAAVGLLIDALGSDLRTSLEAITNEESDYVSSSTRGRFIEAVEGSLDMRTRP
jgi:bifunctional lysine-specific demethylase and histidyl-hydroxylase NO66